MEKLTEEEMNSYRMYNLISWKISQIRKEKKRIISNLFGKNHLKDPRNKLRVLDERMKMYRELRKEYLPASKRYMEVYNATRKNRNNNC